MVLDADAAGFGAVLDRSGKLLLSVMEMTRVMIVTIVTILADVESSWANLVEGLVEDGMVERTAERIAKDSGK